MTCIHLQELYRTCEQYHVRLSSSDLIRIVCPQCGVQEVCPSVYTLEYERREDRPAKSPSSKDEA